MEWFRLYSEARNDAKLRSLSDAQFRVWFNLLCFANDQPRRGEIEGYDDVLLAVEVSNGDTELLNSTILQLEKLRILEASDGLLSFINWGKRQYEKPSNTPERVRERVARHREKKRNANTDSGNADVTPSNTHVTPGNAIDTDTDTETDIGNKDIVLPRPNKPGRIDYPEPFERFWAHYPRKEDKKTAYREWYWWVVEDKADPESIAKASEHYAAFCSATNREQRFIRLPATFLSKQKASWPEWVDPPDLSVVPSRDGPREKKGMALMRELLAVEGVLMDDAG